MQNFDLPVELSDLIVQLLEKDQASRNVSAQQVADSLQQIERQLRGEAMALTPAKKKDAAPERDDAEVQAPKPKRKGKQTLPWLLIGVAVGGGFLCLVLTRHRAEADTSQCRHRSRR
jgi:hypothetical protein